MATTASFVTIKIVSSLQADPVQEIVYLGTTEVQSPSSTRQDVYLGTTEIWAFNGKSQVYLGTTEIQGSGKITTETVYAGTTEIQSYDMYQPFANYARVRSNIASISSSASYNRVRNEIRDTRIAPTNFAIKVVSDSTRTISGGVHIPEWNLAGIGVQLLDKEASKRLVWDSWNTLHWFAPINAAPDNYWFLITYQADDGDDTTEHPIQYSLPETTSTSVTLTWESDANDDSHVITDLIYGIEIALNQNMTDPVYTATQVCSANQYTSHAVTTVLTVGKRYYWRIRLYDGVTYSAWSVVKYFDIVTERYPTIPIDMPNAGHPVLISGRWRHYHWNTSNMLSKDSSGDLIPYSLVMHLYQRGNSGFCSLVASVSVPFGSIPGDRFYIDHRASNPPVFTILNYDKYGHFVVLGIKILDALGRKYDILDFRYESYGTSWTVIPKSRIIGQTENLGPNPDKTITGIFSWSQSIDPDNATHVYQQVYYDLKVTKTPVIQDNSFYWSVKQYLENDEIYDLMQFGFGDGINWASDLDTNDIPTIGWTGADTVVHSESAETSNMTDDDATTYASIVSSDSDIAMAVALYNTFYIEKMNVLLSGAEEVIIEYYADGAWTIAGSNDALDASSSYSVEYFLGVDTANIRITVTGPSTVRVYAIKALGRPNQIIGSSDVGPILVDEAETDFVQNDLKIQWPDFVSTDPSIIDPSTFTPPVTGLPAFRTGPSPVRYQAVLTRGKTGPVLMSVSGIDEQETTISSVNLSLADVTNVLFEQADLEENGYAMTIAEKDLFYQKVGDGDFYWTVRSRDDMMDTEGWAPFAQWEFDETHYLFWDVSGMDLKPDNTYRVSAYMYPGAVNEEEYQNENVQWEARINSEQNLAEAVSDVYEDIVIPETENALELYTRLSDAEEDDNITFDW